MYNEPTAKQLEKIPGHYETEDVTTDEKIIHMHFFIGGCDWYITEYDPVDKLFFGFANLNDDQNAEWGYISLEEMKESNIKGFEVDRDLNWTVRAVKEVDEIQKCRMYA